MKYTCAICQMVISSSRGLYSHVSRIHEFKNYEYVWTYLDPNFKIETCGWCENEDAVPYVNKDPNGYTISYRGRYLCKSKECKRDRSKYNIRSYEFVKRAYKLTEEEAKVVVSSSSPFHRNYFKSDDEYRKSQSKTSIDSFISRHGDDEGKRRFREYCEFRSYIQSKQSFLDRYGPIDGEIKYIESCKNRAVTLESMIKKYGKEIGEIKYDEFLNKTLGNFVSQESVDCFDFISNTLNLKIRHGKNLTEKRIGQNPVDGYVENNKIVFEYFGDRWHMNPKTHKHNQFGIKGQSAIEVWNNDIERLNTILKSDDVRLIIVIWSGTWKSKREYVINKINEIISSDRQKTIDII